MPNMGLQLACQKQARNTFPEESDERIRHIFSQLLFITASKASRYFSSSRMRIYAEHERAADSTAASLNSILQRQKNLRHIAAKTHGKLFPEVEEDFLRSVASAAAHLDSAMEDLRRALDVAPLSDGLESEARISLRTRRAGNRAPRKEYRMERFKKSHLIHVDASLSALGKFLNATKSRLRKTVYVALSEALIPILPKAILNNGVGSIAPERLERRIFNFRRTQKISVTARYQILSEARVIDRHARLFGWKTE